MQPDFYAEALPTAADVFLLIEVAETSLDYDRDVKIPRYAQAGIPEVWLVDLQAEVVSVYTQPSAAGYQRIRQLHAGESVVATTVAGLEIAVEDILG